MRLQLRNPNDDVRIETTDNLASAIGVSRGIIDYVLQDPAIHYHRREIDKGNGKVRIIHPPSGVLKLIQRSLLRYFYKRYKIPGHIHGGIPKRSIITNARPHVGKMMVATFDIRDFFPNTTFNHLLPAFHIAGFRKKALDSVVNLTTLDGRLVQGSPASSFLANLGFLPADLKIAELVKRRNLWLGRYVDDIVISGSQNFRDLKGPIVDRIESEGFPIAEEKTRFMPRSMRQEVTGIVVNDVMRPTSQFIADLKNMIRVCQNEGAASVAEEHSIPVGRLKASLRSKACFLRTADRKLGEKLRQRLYSIDWRSPTPVM